MKTPLINLKSLNKDIIYERFGIGQYERFAIDKEEYIKKYGKDIYEKKEREKLLKIELKLEHDLIKQYVNENVEEIIREHGEEEVARFLNNISDTFVKNETPLFYSKGSFGELSDDIKRKFYNLSLLENSNYNVTIDQRQFLKLCRVCFDAAPTMQFGEEVSDYYVYAYENELELHDDIRIIKSINEEIKNENTIFKQEYERAQKLKEMEVCKSRIGFVKNEQGMCEMKINLYNLSDLIRGILMYIAIRENGYTIAIDAKSVLKAYEKYNFES